MIFEQINTEEETTYLHHDQQGSTRLLTGEKGEVLGTYTYGPYGETTAHTGTATTALGYDTQYTSPDTGLIYLRARVYDPATAQFLSVDPIAELTRQPYTYALNDPLDITDPSGLCGLLEVSCYAEEGAKAVAKGVEAGTHFVEQHYGQIAEASAVGICLSGVGTIPCALATGGGFIASTVQNVMSPSGFSPASEALDILGTLPGAQVTGADLADLLGEGGGQTAAELFSAIVGGSAILGESPIAEAEAVTILCERVGLG